MKNSCVYMNKIRIKNNNNLRTQGATLNKSKCQRYYKFNLNND